MRATIKTTLTWIIAIQLLNTSIWNENYGSYFQNPDSSADPTETIMELLVELNVGQVSAFNLQTHAPDSKFLLKIDIWKVKQSAFCSVPIISFNRKIVRPLMASQPIQNGFTELPSPPPRAVASFI